MRSESRTQLELLPNRLQPHVEPLTPELIAAIRRKSTLSQVWKFSQDHADLEDKQVYSVLDMDSSQWTKIRKGQMWPPCDERFGRYMDLVGNEFPLVWLAESRGYDFLTMRKHRSDQERRIAELEEENRALKRSMRHWAEAQRPAEDVHGR